MHRRLFLGGALAAAMPASQAFAQRADAATAVAQACREAAASNRRTLLVFYASWCGYCQLMDMALADKKAKPLVERHYLVAHLRSQEMKPKQQALQLPGADDVYSRYAPKDVSLPYMAVLDENAGKITDSVMANGENFGFPVDPHELDAFEVMMKVGAPSISADDLKVLRRACVKFKP